MQSYTPHLVIRFNREMLICGRPHTNCSKCEAVSRVSSGTGMIHDMPSRTADICRSISCTRKLIACSTYSWRLANVIRFSNPSGEMGTDSPDQLVLSKYSSGITSWKLDSFTPDVCIFLMPSRLCTNSESFSSISLTVTGSLISSFQTNADNGRASGFFVLNATPNRIPERGTDN